MSTSEPRIKFPFPESQVKALPCRLMALDDYFELISLPFFQSLLALLSHSLLIAVSIAPACITHFPNSSCPCLLLCWCDSQSTASAQAVSSLLSPLSPEAVQVPQSDSWANTNATFCLLLPKESLAWAAGKAREALEHTHLIFGTWRCLDLRTYMKFFKCSRECWELKT